MTALVDLIELTDLAVRAESDARAAIWQDRSTIEKARARVAKTLASDRAAIAQPSISAISASAIWQSRLAEMLDSRRYERPGLCAAEPVIAAARAEADADAAVAVAGLALIEAHRAVLQARAACLQAGDSGAVADAVRGYRPLSSGRPAVRHGRALRSGVTDEFVNILTQRPRSILVKLAIGLGLGLGYLGFIRFFQWESKSELHPYLALYALSGVIGGVVCTNALSWDAGRVRAALTDGRRLWHLLLSKNITMLLLVGAAGLILSVLLAWRSGSWDVLVKAVGQLITMMILWLGVGNVLSVLAPLRVEPLLARLSDGTLRAFLASFVTSYVIGLGVNLALTWRIWARESMIDELGGPWIPVLTLILSAFMTYLLLTVLAVSLAGQPRIRRALLREMIDYKTAKATT